VRVSMETMRDIRARHRCSGCGYLVCKVKSRETESQYGKDERTASDFHSTVSKK
jgi:hypothetical protein